MEGVFMFKKINEDSIMKLMDWVVKLEQENLNQLDDANRYDIVKKIYDKFKEEIKCNLNQ